MKEIKENKWINFKKSISQWIMKDKIRKSDWIIRNRDHLSHEKRLMQMSEYSKNHTNSSRFSVDQKLLDFKTWLMKGHFEYL